MRETNILITQDRIDYVIVIFRNYNLLDIQRDLFERFNSNYRLIIVDNTPDNEKKPIEARENELVVYRNSVNEFDGVSHGAAIDYGLQFVESEIVCILDSDFFILDKNIDAYVRNKISEGYEAIGTEFGDKAFREKHPDKFDNIPCIFCYFCKTEFAKKYTWIVDRHEVDFGTSFIETGWRFRKHILDNSTKVIGWKIDNIEVNTKQIYRNEFGDVVGMHYFAGSHFRLNEDIKGEFNRLCGEYVQKN